MQNSDDTAVAAIEITSTLDPKPGSSALVRASSKQRFLTFAIDIIAIFVFSFSFFTTTAALGLTPQIQQMNEHLLGALLMITYYIIFETYYGKSIGKMVMKTKVVSEHGGQATLKQVFIRSVCRFIPFEYFSLLAQDDGGPIGWHDKMAKTLVVTSVPHATNESALRV